MNIYVLVKRVPDTETKVQICANGKGLNPAGVNFVLNPYDEYAVEEALKTKEKAGGGEVTVLSLGPDETAQTLRQALAMGADKAIHLKDAAKRDALGIAQAIAETLKGASFDMIWAGKYAIDDQSFQVPAMVATLLDIPYVGEVTRFEVDGGKALATRAVEGSEIVMEVSLPAVFGAGKGLNEPRYASLKGIMAAKKKPLDAKEVPAADPRLSVAAMGLPPARQAGKILTEGAGSVPELIRLLREEAKAF